MNLRLNMTKLLMLSHNDPALAQPMEGVLDSALGKDNVVVEEPGLASKDFS